ncbi:MAG: WD40/YVTN/BNR-like repeat-containing protein [Acidimicrobiales bacterium]
MTEGTGPDEPGRPDEHDAGEKAPASPTKGAGWRRKLGRSSRRAALVTAVVAVCVVVAATTIGVEVSRALSGPTPAPAGTGPTPSVPTTSGPPVTGPTTPPGPGGGGPSTTTTTTLPQTGAPIVPQPGGAAEGHGAFNAVACRDASTCLAVGGDDQGAGVIASTTDAGATWTTVPLPSGIATLDAVRCAHGPRCIAAGQGAVLISTDGGSTWALHSPPANTTLLGVSCATTTDCLTVGVTPNPTGPYGGVLLRSTDGGGTWQPVTLPRGTPGLEAVTCPTKTRCVAVGGTVLRSVDGGKSWKVAPVAGGIQGLRSVSCTNASHCTSMGPNPEGVFNPTVAGDAIVTTDGGATWHALKLPTGTASLEDLTCPSATRCYAGGPELVATRGATFETSTDAGTTWQAQQPPHGMSQISAMACPTATTCVMVGRSGTQPVTAASSNTPGAAAATWAVTAVPSA